MEQVYIIALKIALPTAIGAFVLSGIIYLMAWQLSKGRKTVRELRIALEHDPSPGQLAEAERLFPEAKKYASTLRISEMVKCANREEGRQVERIEAVLGWSRTVLAIGVLLGILLVAGKVWPPGGKPQAPPPAESSEPVAP